MDIIDMLEFCAEVGFDGVDITGYYFKGYPLPPERDYLYSIKRKAHALGIEISGTGVRNDFTIPDKILRASEVQRVTTSLENTLVVDLADAADGSWQVTRWGDKTP